MADSDPIRTSPAERSDVRGLNPSRFWTHARGRYRGRENAKAKSVPARAVKHAGSFPRGLPGCMVKLRTGQDPRLDRHRLHRGVSHGRRKETEQATRSRASGVARTRSRARGAPEGARGY